jgi:hypothetical protein
MVVALYFLGAILCSPIAQEQVSCRLFGAVASATANVEIYGERVETH